MLSDQICLFVQIGFGINVTMLAYVIGVGSPGCRPRDIIERNLLCVRHGHRNTIWRKTKLHFERLYEI